MRTTETAQYHIIPKVGNLEPEFDMSENFENHLTASDKSFLGPHNGPMTSKEKKFYRILKLRNEFLKIVNLISLYIIKSSEEFSIVWFYLKLIFVRNITLPLSAKQVWSSSDEYNKIRLNEGSCLAETFNYITLLDHRDGDFPVLEINYTEHRSSCSNIIHLTHEQNKRL